MTSATLLLLALATGPSTVPEGAPAATPATCTTAPATGPEYYAFALAPTGHIPGTGLSKARAEIAFSGSSVFPVALASDGSYVYDVNVRIERMKAPRSGTLVAWVTTPDLDRVERMGALDEHFGVTGSVSWNKFIVVVTLEAEDDPAQEMWTGPIAFRGMSRSGAMHTMVGHGALQQENCAMYGYGS